MNNGGTAPKPVWACAIVPCRNSIERPDDSRFVSWKARPSSGTAHRVGGRFEQSQPLAAV